MIKLYPVAITDLSVRFARDMGSNKVRHYIIAPAAIIVNKFTGTSFEDAVRDYIKETENEDVEFVKSVKSDIDSFETLNQIPPPEYGSLLNVLDATPIVLGRDSKVRKALEKTKSQGILHQTNYYGNFLGKLHDRLAYRYNKHIVPNVNKILYAIQGYDYAGYQPMVKQLRLLDLKYLRVINRVEFISVAFSADDAIEALESIREDLRKLQKAGLIMGHLAMPSIMALADTVGVGSTSYVLFCFPIIDEIRFQKLTKTGPLDIRSSELRLARLGVQNQTFEGGINWLNGKDPKSKVEIEEINVFQGMADRNREKVISQYEATREDVNKAAAATNANIKRYKKMPLPDNAPAYTRDTIEFLDNETGELFLGLDELRKRTARKS